MKFITHTLLALLTIGIVFNIISCSPREKGIDSPKEEPGQPEDTFSFQTLSSGFKHTLALDKSGKLYGWGNSEEGALGEKSAIVAPKLIENSEWLCVTAGYESSLGIKKDGTLWGSGYNNTGQLGTGKTEDLHQFQQIGTDKDWVKVNLGYRHALAIKKDGSIWAWGNNEKFQLADGSDEPGLIPKQIGTDKDWQDIAAAHSQCFAIKKDGSLWAWGYNYAGQLGTGNTNNMATPVKINSDKKWKTIVSGISFSGGIKEDGSLWMWGRNYHGELGIGTGKMTNGENSSVPVKVNSDIAWKKISLGNGHVLALKTDNTLWAWGKNTRGELGIGGETSYSVYKNTPVKVNESKDWTDIAAGEVFSIAQKNSGEYWGWGSNSQGQLSTKNDQENVPIKIFK